MGARINNAPVYVVNDLSYKQTIILTHKSDASTYTQTGTENYIIDKNLTTYLQYQGVGGYALSPEIWVTIDYGKIYWNCHLFVAYKMYAYISNINRLEYSTDNITWTTLENPANNTYTEFNTQVMKLRYIRFHSKSTTSSGATLIARATIYQCRIMGS